MSRKQQVYSDFSGGFNDSIAAISIKDNEVCISENADYSAEIKSFRTRKGCSKVNNTSFAYEVTDCHTWSIGSVEKKVLVVNSKVYDFNQQTGQLGTEKCTLSNNATKIYPFVLFNRFYFGDGTTIRVWGDFDYESSQGSVSLTTNQIVKNTTSTTGSSVLGNFYKYTGSDTTMDLTAVNYSGSSWVNVTEVPYFASNVVREIIPHNAAQHEIVRIAVVSGANANGTITVCLNNEIKTTSISSGAAVSAVATAINGLSFIGWTSTIESNVVIFTKTTNVQVQNGYVDPGTTGCTLTYTTAQEGKVNDNNLDPIKKCTMFIVHTASYRVFACGNPDDNALFYSEIGNPAYFKSDYNKVYAINSYGKPTGLFQFSDSVLISFETGWYCWDGITPLEDASWRPLNIPYGCVSNRSIALTPHSFIYLGRDGIYSISAAILNSEILMVQGSQVIQKISKSKVDKTINDIYDLTQCEGVFYNNVYYLAYNTSSTSGNSNVLKYEWDTNSFTVITGWKVNAWCYDSESLFFGSKNYFIKANDGYSDVDLDTGADNAINLYIKTKEYSLGNPFVDKVVNLVGLIFKQDDSVILEDGPDVYAPDGKFATNHKSLPITADVRILMGYDSYEINTINISESLVWGRDWGLLWGFREAITKMVELTMSSNTFQIEIRNNTLNSPITLVAIGFVYEDADFVIPTILKDEDLLL